MKIQIRSLQAITLLLVAIVLSCSNTAQSDELGQATRNALGKSSASIVRIRVIGSSGGDELEVSSQVTTGVVISEDGEIMTSVFGFGGQPAAIFVEDSNGDRVAASVVATDHLRKLVLLKCKEGVFKPARFATERWPDVGAYSVAAGKLYPGKLPAASVGVISANKRIHGIAVQTDAKISPVNYGGPLMDLKGTVLGILVPLSPRDSGEGINAGVQWYDSGIGFAIPATDVLQIAELLRSGKDRSRGLLGIAPSTQNPLAETFTVSSISPNSPASKAGIRVGDKITSVNGTKVTRFGVFQSLLKSSYAGDSLTLTIGRKTENISIDAELVSQLPIVRPTYLGVMAVSTNSDKETKGLAVHVVPNSPLSKQGITGTIQLLKIDDSAISSTADLRKQLRSYAVGQELNLAYTKTEDPENEQSTSVVLENTPNTVASFDDDLIDEVCGGNQKTEWQRKQDDVPDGGKMLTYAPNDEKVKDLGVVVLLSESQTAHEVITKRWQDICKQHGLMIVVPTNSEDRELSREDSEFIMTAIRLAVAGRNIDPSRIVLVANKPQAELCGELLLNGKLRQLRAAVFVETWPRFTGVPASVIAGKSPSFLILNGIVQSRSAQALRAQAVRHISESGASVIESDLFETTSAETAIANWALGLKAF